MGLRSSQIAKEDIKEPTTAAKPNLPLIEETIPEQVIEKDYFKTQKSSPPQDPFRTPTRKRRYSFEIRIPSPAECFKMARPLELPMSEPPRPVKRKRISNHEPDNTTDYSSPRGKLKDTLSPNGNNINHSNILSSQRKTPRKKQRTSAAGTPSSSRKSIEPVRNDDGQLTFRPGHVSHDNSKRTGWYSPEEVEKLENFKVKFCNDNRITADVFDMSVQSSFKQKYGIFDERTGFTTHSEFWKEVYEILPERDQRSIYRFSRRHFQSGNKPHEWTTEDENELARFVNKYGTKWSQIAREMERTQDDVIQRWKNKVEHRSTMVEGLWEEEESLKLLATLEEIHAFQVSENAPKSLVGKDIYGLEDCLISWGAVSDKLQNRRSRKQCADKWRKIKRSVLQRREWGEPDAVYEPSKPTKPGRKTRNSFVNIKKASESEERVIDSSDEAEDDEVDKTEKSLSKSARVKGVALEDSESSSSSSEEDSSEDSSDDSSDDSDDDDNLENKVENGQVAKSDNSDSDSDSDSDSESESESESDSDSDNNNDNNQTSKVEITQNPSREQSTESEESEVQETQSQASSSPSPSPSPAPSTNGQPYNNSHAQPSQELGVEEKIAETDIDEAPSIKASPVIKQEHNSDSELESESESESSSGSGSGSDSDSDNDNDSDSDSGSGSDSDSDSDSDSEPDNNDNENKIFTFKREPTDSE